jgi:multiple sugar transport system permease protein
MPKNQYPWSSDMAEKLKKYNYTLFVILFAGSVLMIFPFVWMFLSAFKNSADVYAYPPKWIPSEWKVDNFLKVFKMIPFGIYYANSIYTSIMQTSIQLIISIAAAYVLTVLDFPFKNFFLGLIRSTMFVPMVVTMIPLYLMVSAVRLMDTYAGIILPQVFGAFDIFLLVSFFSTIPVDLYNSAKIDGCGYYRIMANVVIPNSKSAISTAALFSFLGHWKSYTWPLIVTNKQIHRTLPIGMKYLSQEPGQEYHIMMAASLMAILPVIIAFLFFEKQLVRSITLTGIKA